MLLAQTDITSLLPQISEYATSGIAVGIGILMFVLGRKIVTMLTTDEVSYVAVEHDPDDPGEYYTSTETDEANESYMETYHEIADAFEAGEIDEDEARALADEYY